MRREDAAAALQGALALSHEILAVADSGDVQRVTNLDAERRRLLKSLQHVVRSLDEGELSVLRTIADVNAQSLGRMEHRFRAKCRDLDMLGTGRRALRAYGYNRP
jgi:hypothetical protein